MRIHTLYSGSKGNATRIISESGDTDVLIDVGVSWTKIKKLTYRNYKPTAILVTHEHYDHITGVGVAGRATGSPIHILEKCYNAKKPGFFKGCDIHFFESGDLLDFGELQFQSFSVRHDCNDICCFTVYEPETDKKLAFLTDTGAITRLIAEHIKDCDAYCIEMDYDTDKLAAHKEYDPILKQRISSPWGHLSNQQSLEYIEENINFGKVEFICALHLSENTNSPELVSEQFEKRFGKLRAEKFHCAPTPDILTLN